MNLKAIGGARAARLGCFPPRSGRLAGHDSPFRPAVSLSQSGRAATPIAFVNAGFWRRTGTMDAIRPCALEKAHIPPDLLALDLGSRHRRPVRDPVGSCHARTGRRGARLVLPADALGLAWHVKAGRPSRRPGVAAETLASSPSGSRPAIIVLSTSPSTATSLSWSIRGAPRSGATARILSRDAAAIRAGLFLLGDRSRYPSRAAAFPAAGGIVAVYPSIFCKICNSTRAAPNCGFDAHYLALPPPARRPAISTHMLKRALPLTVLPYRRDRLLVDRVRRLCASRGGRFAGGRACRMRWRFAHVASPASSGGRLRCAT